MAAIFGQCVNAEAEAFKKDESLRNVDFLGTRLVPITNTYGWSLCVQMF